MVLNPSPPGDYYEGFNETLFRAVPDGALTVLEVGCGAGNLGAALKAADARRRVYGLEYSQEAADRAAERLDAVFHLDVERDDPPLDAGSLDCILYGDVLEHLHDAEAVLRRHRPLLRPGGCVLASFPNVGHVTILAALLRDDWQYQSHGLLDRTHLRLFGLSSVQKLFLDAGLMPEALAAIQTRLPDGLLSAAEPLLRYLGVSTERAAWHLGAFQMIVRGDPLPEPPDGPDEPLTFTACVWDEEIAKANLLASPDLQPGTPHEVLLGRGPSVTAALNALRGRARHRWVVAVQEDVYLPRGWPRRLLDGLRRAEAALGPVGAAGVYGAVLRGGRAEHVGRLVYHPRLAPSPVELPAPADTLDELLLAVPRDGPIRLDEQLGSHLYAADACLQARARGLAVAAVLAPCVYNSKANALPPEFGASGQALARKWADRLPVATARALIDASWLPPGSAPRPGPA